MGDRATSSRTGMCSRYASRTSSHRSGSTSDSSTDISRRTCRASSTWCSVRILSYNLTFVTGAVLNLLCARSLARRLSPHRLVHVIAAVAFLTAPPIALNAQVGLLPLFWAFTLPLLLGDAIDVVTGQA